MDARAVKRMFSEWVGQYAVSDISISRMPEVLGMISGGVIGKGWLGDGKETGSTNTGYSILIDAMISSLVGVPVCTPINSK